MTLLTGAAAHAQTPPPAQPLQPAAAAAVTDDPYLWLEDVNGERRSPGCASATPGREGARRRSGLRDAAHRAADDPRLRARASRRSRKHGPVSLQLLARREEPARPVAAHHARRVPQGRSRRGRPCSTSTRSAAAEKRELGVGTAPSACGPSLRALPGQPVARRRRCRRSSASSTSRRRRSSRAASPCPRRRATSAGRTATTCASAPTSAPASMTDSGYPRIVKEWKRGTPLGERRAPSTKVRPTTSRRSRNPRPTRAASATGCGARSTFWNTEFPVAVDGTLQASSCRTTRRCGPSATG